MDKYIGKKLEGRYEITELIGVGGMADVYKATDIIDNKEVAVKILKKEFRVMEEEIFPIAGPLDLTFLMKNSKTW